MANNANDGKTPSIPPDGFGLSNLRSVPVAPRVRSQTVDIRLTHPREAEIVQRLQAIGTEEAQQVINLLTTDGLYVRFATTTVVDGQTVPYTVNGEPAVNLGSWSLWAAKPSDDADDNQQKMLYKSWGRTVVGDDGKPRVVGRGFVRAFVAAANDKFRRVLGLPPKPAAVEQSAQPMAARAARPAPAPAGGDTEVNSDIPF